MKWVRIFIIVAGVGMGWYGIVPFMTGNIEGQICSILFTIPATLFLLWFGIDYLGKYDKLDKE